MEVKRCYSIKCLHFLNQLWLNQCQNKSMRLKNTLNFHNSFNFVTNTQTQVRQLNMSIRKDSLEGSLDRVIFAAELEFPKILVPRLPQHISDVNTDCAGKSEWPKQLYSLYLTSFFRHWYIFIFIILILIDFNWWCLV